MILAMITIKINFLLSVFKMSIMFAPNTFLMPISLLRFVVINAERAKIPTMESISDNSVKTLTIFLNRRSSAITW